jgi:site-specific DNA-methyltransferase (adenine-specific)
MGSGTTALACLELDRHFVGIELMENYYREATERIKQKDAALKLPFDRFGVSA